MMTHSLPTNYPGKGLERREICVVGGHRGQRWENFGKRQNWGGAKWKMGKTAKREERISIIQVNI